MVGMIPDSSSESSFSDIAASRSRVSAMVGMIPDSSSESSFSSSSSDSPWKANYIQHRVSKMDTLPGVAIKYGVEVEDIKRLNGLVTDIQMFALRTLQIPLPGRHPPSHPLSRGSFPNEDYSRYHNTPQCRPSDDMLDLLNSLNLKTTRNEVSTAMGSPHSYYDLRQIKNSPVLEGTEMVAYRTSISCLDDELWPIEPPFSDLFSGQHRKSGGLVNGFPTSDCETKENLILDSAESGDTDKSIRRRQKGDAIPSLGTSEISLKEDNGNGFCGRKGKGLAMRSKLGSQTDMAIVDPNASNGDSFVNVESVSVRKSSSTSNLQESESSSSFIWPTSKWILNPEFLARSLFVFDGLPNPITVWKSKAALD